MPFLILDGQFSGRSTPLMIAGPQGSADSVTCLGETPSNQSRVAIDVVSAHRDSLFWLASLLETCASPRWKAVSNLVYSPQHLCSTLADDDAGSHGVAGRYARHNRPIRNTKVVDSIDFEAAINDGH